jgi:hypothetical protein
MIDLERERERTSFGLGKFSSLVTMAVASLLTSRSVPSQQVEKTFHLYVDPIYGDDDPVYGAPARNPLPSSTPGSTAGPLQNHPLGTSAVSGNLQHAPYSFRTVTNAIDWIETTLGGPGTPPLPWTNAALDPPQTVRHIVIHCMPGLYGPRDPQTPDDAEDFDPRSGLPWNGETFPIRLPDRVSLQGTSALDTIFDARGYDEPAWTTQNIFLFDAGITINDPMWSDSFIDGIAMRGCRYRPYVGSLEGAAVLIQGSTPVDVLISNCFIYGNDLGIALIETTNDLPYHRPRIVHDTIAWNQIGIYSGSSTFPSTGYSRPAVLNTVIDPIRPVAAGLPAYLLGLGGGAGQPPSSFEGLAAFDLQATASCGSGPPVAANFNAYHTSLVNIGTTWPFGATSPRQAVAAYPPANTRIWTGDWNNGAPARGSLFVNDVLRRAGLACAPHDFRLAPMTTADGISHFPNGLVNAGADIDRLGITFDNGTQVLPDPGIPDDGLANFHAADWDAEGYGNPRIAARRLDTGSHFPSVHCDQLADLGADEMGELIITGFVDSTRLLASPHASFAAQTATLPDCSRFYFLNVAAPTQPFVAPQLNARHDPAAFTAAFPAAGSPHWFAQLGMHNPFLLIPEDPSPPFVYTGGQHDFAYAGVSTTTRFRLTMFTPPGAWAPLPDFMRNRVCDIAPHLLDDINTVPPPQTPRAVDHAEFDFYLPPAQDPVTVLKRDVFQANPWHNMPTAASFPWINDNAFLYVDGSTKQMKTGHITPPMVIAHDPIHATLPSTFLFREGTAHPIHNWGAPSYTYSVGANGLSAGNPAPYVPGMDWYGIRINFELFEPDHPLWTLLGDPLNNLQTVLAVTGLTVGGENRSTSSPPPALAEMTGAMRAAEADAAFEATARGGHR